MAKNLVIVESPAKAKTIVKYLGSDFKVKSSFGHLRDLPKKDLGVDIDKGFKPIYQISPDKEKTAKELKDAAKGSIVWLASDGDREGEAIAWHICYVMGIKPESARRIVFHEITEPAITAAVAKPRKIDMKLVHAQQARRILDRLVGYELSPVLWKKVRPGLSAGRVQSVAVRLAVDREREIKDFKSDSFYKVTAIFKTSKGDFTAELPEKLDSEAKARDVLNAAKKASFEVEDISQKPGMRSPSAPFTTSTLQQEAARKLGFSVRQTMTLAQKLYESGQITYMRTDSTNMSSIAINAAKNYVIKQYGDKYSNPTNYQTKSKLAQEAHEAIRPSHLDKLEAGRDMGQKKLYKLIWRRAVASQMAPAQIERTEVIISMSGKKVKFVANGEVLKFDGFLKVYGGGKDDRILPPMVKGQKLNLSAMEAVQSFTKPPARYSEASLVKKLEELGIGRPSTYAPIIGTIQSRGYIEKTDIEGVEKEIKHLKLQGSNIKEDIEKITVGADRYKLVATDLAEIVTDFLTKHFAEIVDYNFTAGAEQELDDIADGKLVWQDMLKHFYKSFHPLIGKAEKVSRSEVSQARKLGIDPKTKLPIFVRYGRFGPVLQLGETVAKNKKDSKDVEDKVQFAPMPENATLDDITLQQALPMFRLPRDVGKTADGEAIIANIGRFGPYVRINSTFVSIKDYDPFKITESEARRAINKKLKKDRERIIADFGKIQILNGPYGPFITNGKTNVKVPKDIKPDSIKEDKAKELLENPPVKNKSL